jgi:hypothetical protein
MPTLTIAPLSTPDSLTVLAQTAVRMADLITQQGFLMYRIRILSVWEVR